MPFIIPLSYLFLLPSPSPLLARRTTTTPSAYVQLASADNAEGLREDIDDDNFGDEEDEEQEFMTDDAEDSPPRKTTVTLSANDKWRLVKPLMARYMLPLCASFLICGSSSFSSLFVFYS